MGIRIDEATTDVVQTFMEKDTHVNEFAALDPDGGGNYLTPWKQTYYIQNLDHSRIKLKSLESFTYDPSHAAQFFLPPGLVTSNHFHLESSERMTNQ